MPLEFQPIEVAYGQLDTKTDPTALDPGALTTAENVSSQVDGRYSKRFGYQALTQPVASGSVRLAKRGSELLFLDNRTQYKYTVENGSWDQWPYNVPNVSVSEKTIQLEQSSDFAQCTRCTANGVTLHAWIDESTGFLTVYVFSEIDGSVLTGFTDTSNAYQIVHMVALGPPGDQIAIFYSSYSGQVIRYATFDSHAFTFTAATTYLSGANVYAGTVGYARAPFDICAYSNSDVCLSWATNTPEIKVVRRNVLANTDSTSAIVLSADIPDGGFGIATCSTTVGAIAYHSSSAAGVRLRGFNPSTSAATFATGTIEADGGFGNNFNVGLVAMTSNTAMVVWDRRKTSPAYGSCRGAPYNIAVGTSAGAGFIHYNYWLASKPFTYGSRQFVAVISPLKSQQTYFTVDITPNGVGQNMPIAMHGYRTATTSGPGVACLPDSDLVSTGVYAFDGTQAFKFLSNSSPRSAVATYQIDFTDIRRFLNVEMGQSVYYTGGITWKYDGRHVSENNFLVYPEIESATPGAVGAGGLNDGTYSYLVVFETSDHSGNVDRSTTSLPVSATTSAGAGKGKVDLVITSLNITHRIFTDSPVVASVFRTENNGETYYFVTSQAVDRTMETFSYSDSTPDSVIINNRIVYTQGDALDREPLVPVSHMVVHNNRVWGIKDKNIFYSGDYVPGENPWFSAIQTFNIDPGGDFTAIASMDGVLILFKRDRVFQVTGRGGNETGTSSDLTPPVLITSDCGCIEPRSVVLIPQGLMFQSDKGIYMLTRGMELTYVGMPVDYYITNYPVITSAQMMPLVREVRFQATETAGQNGVVLVYNYRDNRWTTHTNFAASYTDGGGNPVTGVGTAARNDSLVLGASYYTVDWHGFPYVETSGYRDVDTLGNQNYITSTIETGWIKPAGKQGLVRCQRVVFLNEFLENHNMEFELDKDYVNSSVQSANYTAADISALPQEQVALHVQNQQGESWRIRMHDSDFDGVGSQGYRARGVTFLVGVKRGTVEKIMQAGAKA